MRLSEQQKDFLRFAKGEREKSIDVRNASDLFRAVVLNLFVVYISANSKTDREDAAWMIYTIKDKFKKKISLWHLIEDEKEYFELLKSRCDRDEEVARRKQARRHEKRDDFSLTDIEWNEAKEYFNNKCAYCGEDEKLTYDHFHPFSKGGDFMKGNVIPCCRFCNTSKHNSLFEQWYSKQPFYNSERKNKVINYVNRNKQLTLL